LERKKAVKVYCKDAVKKNCLLGLSVTRENLCKGCWGLLSPVKICARDTPVIPK